jgi:hypothetical protein
MIQGVELNVLASESVDNFDNKEVRITYVYGVLCLRVDDELIYINPETMNVFKKQNHYLIY